MKEIIKELKVVNLQSEVVMNRKTILGIVYK